MSLLNKAMFTTYDYPLAPPPQALSVVHVWPNTGNGILAGEYLIYRGFDALSNGENHNWILILEPEISLFKVTSLTLFNKPSFLIDHLITI